MEVLCVIYAPLVSKFPRTACLHSGRETFFKMSTKSSLNDPSRPSRPYNST
ncbi:unnamed protein product, partial [Nesidiocoris tenuis]